MARVVARGGGAAWLSLARTLVAGHVPMGATTREQAAILQLAELGFMTAPPTSSSSVRPASPSYARP